MRESVRLEEETSSRMYHSWRVTLVPADVRCKETHAQALALYRLMGSRPLFDRNLIPLIAEFATNAVKVLDPPMGLCGRRPGEVPMVARRPGELLISNDRQLVVYKPGYAPTRCSVCQTGPLWNDAYPVGATIRCDPNVRLRPWSCGMICKACFAKLPTKRKK